MGGCSTCSRGVRRCGCSRSAPRPGSTCSPTGSPTSTPPGSEYGAAGSPVRLDPAWDGPLEPWPDLEVVERRGCDLHPVDPRTTQGRLTLTAYVWPDQSVRLERLRGALRLAADAPDDVDTVAAGDFVDGIELVPGTTTVLWHSIMWQYLPADEQDRITARLEELGAATSGGAASPTCARAGARRCRGAGTRFLVVLTEWHDGEKVRRVLGTAPPHGVPVAWEPG